MLSDEEQKRLVEIRKQLQEGDPGSPTDTAFLLELIARFERTKPEDFTFPPRLGLANDIGYSVYKMRLERRCLREATVGLELEPDGSSFSAFHRFVVSCNVVTAEMWARPYVRVIGAKTTESYERFTRATLSLRIDGDPVLLGYPLRDFMVGPHGFGLNRIPFSFHGHLPRNTVFRAITLEGSHLPAHTPDAYSLWDAMMDPQTPIYIDPSNELGPFMGNGTNVDMQIDGIIPTMPEGQRLQLALGGVAALYTADSKKGFRKQDWSPRDADQELV